MQRMVVETGAAEEGAEVTVAAGAKAVKGVGATPDLVVAATEAAGAAGVATVVQTSAAVARAVWVAPAVTAVGRMQGWA